MRKALLAVALAVLPLCAMANDQARVVATMPNNVGGHIKLTNGFCDATQEHFVAYTTAPNGDVAVGCWALLDNDVVIRYESGTVKVYPANAFNVRPLRPTPRAPSQGL